MGRFLNKQELIIVVLLILLLDFNGFISTALNHIMYGQRRNTWIFLFSVALLLYDIFIFHIIIKHDPIPEVDFKPNENRKGMNCEEILKKQVKENSDKNIKLGELVKECNNDPNQKANKLTEQITLNFVVFVLIMIVIGAALTNGGRADVNPVSKRLILSIPVMIIAGLIFIYANIYQPF